MLTTINRYRKLWTAEVKHIQDDNCLVQIVTENQGRNWVKISSELKIRFSIIRRPKQCRERWTNHFKVLKNQRTWSESDIALVFKLQKHLGNKWSKIAKYIPGQSNNSIKNLYYSTIRRNLRRFNKGKKSSDKIKGEINHLMLIPEIREILSTSPYISKKLLREKQLDRSVLEKIHCSVKEKEILDLWNYGQTENIFKVTSRNKTQMDFGTNLYSDYQNINYKLEFLHRKEDYMI